MRKILVAFLLVAGLSAGEPWSKSDIAWEAVYQVLLIADWAQTRQVAGGEAKVAQKSHKGGWSPTTQS